MGFDINGVNPTDNKGDYFRNNVWWWRSLWTLIGARGEYVYREIHDLGQQSNYQDWGDETHYDFIEKWRDNYHTGCMNDGVLFDGEHHEHVITTLKYCIEHKDSPEIKDFIDWMEDQYGSDYPFTWENAEDFLEFCENNEGFEVW